ncbi:hypothetical protein [Streptomyces sp. NBC_00984]|uniref:hypothetical protein n=1 Tax=Streptomyces sp. NBC_00984 TaxID=2903700 RepID=UPI002F9164AC
MSRAAVRVGVGSRFSYDGEVVEVVAVRAAEPGSCFSDSATKQLDAITSEAELHASDRAWSSSPSTPTPTNSGPGDSSGPQLRSYVDDVERGPARVLGDGLEDRGHLRS